jgi:hypothetical protein
LTFSSPSYIRVLAIASVLTGAAMTSFAQSLRPASFEEEIEDWHLVDLDGDGRREVLVFFDDDEQGKPFSVIRRPAQGELQVSPRLHLPADTVAIAMRRQQPKTPLELVLLAPKSISRARWQDGRFIMSAARDVELRPFFRAARQGPPPIWHWDIDYNGDGFGDLMLPVDRGIALFAGQADGELAAAKLVALPGNRKVRPSAPDAISITRSLPHPVFRDVDADGRQDLTWFDGVGLGYARQLPKGDFAPAARFELPWVSEAAGGVVEKTDVSMPDADGDGRNDLLLSRMRTNPERVTDMKTTIVLLRNRGGDVPFGRKPDHAVVIPGVAGVGPTLLDCDGDGRNDLVVGSYGANLAAAVSRLLGGIPFEFQIFRGEAQGFSNRPMSTLKVSVSSDAFSDLGARHCARVMPDLDGDGRVDLVCFLGRGRRQSIVLRPGLSGETLSFSEKPTATVQTRDYRGMTDIDDGGAGARELMLVSEKGILFVDFSAPK